MVNDYAKQRINNRIRMRGFWPGFCTGLVSSLSALGLVWLITN